MIMKNDYSYDKLHRLIDAKYDDQHGNAEAFMTNYGYDKNGNIDCIMRQAITMDYEVAPLDEMELYYTGNQLRAITSFASPDDFEDYTPYPVSDSYNAYSYDQNGNTTKDLDRNILSILYNLLNLPSRITYTDGSMATYTYNSLGEKLRVAYATSSLTASLPAAHVAESEAPDSAETRSLRSGMPNTTVDYCGNLVYNGAGLSRILLGGEGYCQLASGLPVYYFFIKDHLGSIRAVVRQDVSARQCNQYYPYGKSWSGGYSQPYLYNGKEIDMMHGLEWYDYGARMYEPGICRFMTMDPLCEKYYNISPYAYCGNNPVRYVDPDGRRFDDVYYNERGNELYKKKKDGPDNYYVIKTTKKSNEIYTDASPKQKGCSNPISNVDAFIAEISIMNGDITGKHMKNVTYLFNSSQINGILNSIKDDGKGGTSPQNNREYSGNLKPDGVKDTKQSPVGDPSKGQYLISYGNSDYHSHASGTKSTKRTGYSYAWQQGPSAQDIRTAKGNELVFGMGSGIIYKYNKNGVFATIPISIF